MNAKSITLNLAAAVLLGSCTVPPPAGQPAGSAPAAQAADLKSVYAALGKGGGRVYALDPRASAVRIYAFRAGPAARLGHNHVLSAPSFAGFAHLPSSGVGEARFDLAFRLDELEIDNEAYRGQLGRAFSTLLSSEAIEGTREHMLGDDNLQANLFPYVRIRSLQISGEAPKLAARVAVEMHGQQREIWVPLTVEGLPERLSVSGAFVLRQTDFGAKPYYVLGGLIAVQDEIVVEFKLIGT